MHSIANFETNFAKLLSAPTHNYTLFIFFRNRTNMNRRDASPPSARAHHRMSRERMPTTACCLLPCCRIAHALRSCASTSDAARASHIDLSSRRPSGVQQTALTGQRSLPKEEWTKRAQTLELVLPRHAAGGSMSHELAPPAQETSFADDRASGRKMRSLRWRTHVLVGSTILRDATLDCISLRTCA